MEGTGVLQTRGGRAQSEGSGEKILEVCRLLLCAHHSAWEQRGLPRSQGQVQSECSRQTRFILI